MFKTPLFTYDTAKGSSLRRNYATTSSSEPEPPGKEIFPHLGASTSKSLEAVLFFPCGEGMSASPSLLSPDEGVLISLDVASGVHLKWRPPLAFLLSSLSSFTGT